MPDAVNPKDIEAVSGFLARLLVGLASQKTLSIGMSDLPVMAAIKRIPPKEYRRVIKHMVTQPGVSDFLLQAMAESPK